MCLRLWAICSWLFFKGAGKFKGWVSLKTSLRVPATGWPEKDDNFENVILNFFDFVISYQWALPGRLRDWSRTCLSLYALPEAKILVREICHLGYSFQWCLDFIALTAAVGETSTHFLMLCSLVQSPVSLKRSFWSWGRCLASPSVSDCLPCPRAAL